MSCKQSLGVLHTGRQELLTVGIINLREITAEYMYSINQQEQLANHTFSSAAGFWQQA